MLKRLELKYVFYTLILIACFSLSFFYFDNIYKGLFQAFIDIINSLIYYFVTVFSLPFEVTPTVIVIPENVIVPDIIPETVEGFQSVLNNYWVEFFSLLNFLNYLIFVLDFLYPILQYFLIIVMIALLFKLLFSLWLKTRNNDFDRESKALTRFKRFESIFVTPVINWFKSQITWLRNHKAYIYMFLVIWALNFNLFSVVLSVLAFLFYFCVSFDFVSIYNVIVKTVSLLIPMIEFLPLWFYFVVVFVIILIWRRRAGFNRLNHNERKNIQLIDNGSIVTMLTGSMGVGKNCLNVDMCLSFQVQFKNKALEFMQDIMFRFPQFHFQTFENELKKLMKHNTIFNLATISTYIDKKSQRFYNDMTKQRIFGYDFERYGLTYDDNLKIIDIFDDLENYAKCYFIYVVSSSMILSNYAIRSDIDIIDKGNFPMVVSDFFEGSPESSKEVEKFSHILNFDMFRLTKRIITDYEDTFEFGIVSITEIAKERGNKIENAGLKKIAENTNPKNDGFNNALKLIRHNATVCNYPFVRFITDDQRAESWEVDGSNLCDIYEITSKTDRLCLLPFFNITELVCLGLLTWFNKINNKFRFNRSDNNVLIYLMRKFAGKIYNYYDKIHNTFDYFRLTLNFGHGQEGAKCDKFYYLSTKKIYSDRFKTDCYNGYFKYKTLKSKNGLFDIPTYEHLTASMAELESQQSYFIKTISSVLTDKKAVVEDVEPVELDIDITAE